MAIKLPVFKFLKGKNAKKPEGAAAPSTTLIMAGVSKGTENEIRSIPGIGHLPVKEQYKIVISTMLVLVVLAVATLTYHTRRVGNASEYLATATQMQMLSQRIAKGAAQAAQGNPTVFGQLKDGQSRFNKNLARLIKGGDGLPASPSRVQPLLRDIEKQWQPVDKAVAQILQEEKNLVGLNRNVASINASNIQLLELSEQVAGLLTQSGASLREVSIASQQVMLTQRMAKNANALLSSDVIDPEVAFLLGKDTNTYRDVLDGLLKGSTELRLTANNDPDIQDKLKEIDEVFVEFARNTHNILEHMQNLVGSKQAARGITTGGDQILVLTEQLATNYENDRKGGFIGPALAGVFGWFALLALIILGMINVNEAKRGALHSDQENKRNQAAILRLLNEMGDLAEGDLTVKAQVTEDITGAIADSINYTIDELRTLVTGINRATEQVTQATQQAQSISNQLLDAAQRQSQEIQETNEAVLKMAQSINEVSVNATESARVAEQSLAAAEKGASAVQNSISGMNEIREQIQETSKRIKRLGESSQEISEIVELISDITEQTNVLALNAAIQAASAGEAGRGFTVVAEEVQRLAERSGEATKQISAIVKTIQTDTQDAVAAMESSTQGVVEGTVLSDAAGQALSEIGQVSRSLSELIQTISNATQEQAEVAGKVVQNMQDIQNITTQTTEGTKQAALSIGQLAGLASELKGSVAGFKLS
jgi:twitching motility protein PilJ